jgi:hypothetical protein
MRGFRVPLCIGLLHWFLAISAQAALTPDLEASIKRYIQKSPSVNGLRVEVQLIEPNQVIPASAARLRSSRPPAFGCGVEVPCNCAAPRPPGW